MENQPHAPAEPEKDFFESFDLERFWYVLNRSKYWIAGFMVLFLSLAYLYVRYTKPLYRSESVLKLDFESEANVLGLTNAINTQEFNELSGEIELIKSKLFFSRVVEMAGLEVSYHMYGRYLTDERYKNAPFVVSYKILNDRYYDLPFDVEMDGEETFTLSYEQNGEEITGNYAFGEEIRADGFNLLIGKTDHFDNYEKGDFFFTINSDEALIRYLQDNVEVVPENLNAKTIRVSLTDHNKIKARDLVNLIDVLYLAYTEEVKNLTLDRKIAFLDDQIESTERKLEEYEDYFEQFTIENRTTDLDQDLSRTIEQLAAFDSQRFELRRKVRDIQLLRQQVEANDQVAVNPLSITQLPKPLDEALLDYTSLIEERELKLGSYNETSYVIRQFDLKLDQSKEALFALLDVYIQTLNERLELVDQRRAMLERNLSSLPSMGTEYGKNRRVYSLQEEFMISLQQSKMELEITRAGTVTNSVILSPASVSSIPIKPQKLLIMGAAGVLALMLSIFYLLIRYLAHNKIAGTRELEKLVSVPVLGSIPRYHKEPLNHTALVIKKGSRSSLSEALRTLRTNMDFIDGGKQSKLVSVTSTVSGEGKTFVAANLGAIIAMTNQKVCVVDIDMRKPKVHLAFGGHAAEGGVSTLLAGQSNLDACIQEDTGIENLSYVAAGPTPPNPSELLLQKEFDDLLKEMRKKFDVILLDTPPVGLVTDARIAMAKSDIQLYVFRADYSKRSFTKTLNDLRSTEKFPNMTAILNSIASTSGYGYGYGHGYYHEEST